MADDNCDHDYGGCYIKDILLYITIMYEGVNSMEVKEKWRGVWVKEQETQVIK